MSGNGNALENRPEFNWHPKLHAHQGEVLWFFLIRFVDPTAGALEDQIRVALERAGLQHACTYALYGYWDGLLRIWMTVDVKRKFLRLMKDPEFGVDDIRSFEVSGLYYMWLDEEEDLLNEEGGPALDKLTGLESVVRSARGDVAKLTEHARAKLHGNGLLIDRPPWPQGGIKLYIALNYTTSSSVTYDLEVSLVSKAIRASGLAKRCSLYVGDGFSRFLLRCIADDYESVLSQTQAFYDELSQLHAAGLPLRPTTFVIIKASEESDDLNVFESLSMRDEHTARRLDLTDTGRKRFSEIPQSEKDTVHHLMTSVDELAVKEDARLSDALIGLLRACIENNHAAVTSSLSFLIDVEWLYREYMIRVWARVYGKKKWKDTLTQRLADTNGGAPASEPPAADSAATDDGESDGSRARSVLEREPSKWSFGDVHKLAELSSEDDPEIRAILTREVGRNWNGRLHALLGLRNFTMHGYIRGIADLSDLSGMWGQQVEDAINSAEMYFALDKLLNRTEISNDGH